MAKQPVHLVDTNVLLALLDEAHVHHRIVQRWFDTPGLRWALCPFTEAAVLRYFTRPKTGDLSMEQVTTMLDTLKQQPGYRYQPIAADWHALTKPFAKRIHGHNQVTDAYLLGTAIQEGLVLTTFDKGMQHLAQEHQKNILLLEAP